MAPTLRHRTGILSWALLRLLVWLPLWLLGLVCFLLGLLLSPWGTGLVLDQARERGLIDYQSVAGAPLDDLRIDGLRLDAGPAEIAIRQLEWAWAEECLLNGRLCLDHLRLDGLRVRLAATEAEESPPGDPLESIALPLPIELRELSVSDAEIRLADGTRLSWREFVSGAVGEGEAATLLATRLSGLRLYLPPSPGQRLAGRLGAEAIDAAIAVAEGEPPAPPAPPLAERERLSLPQVHLPLGLTVRELLVEDVELGGAVSQRLERLYLEASARGETLVLERLELDHPQASVRLAAEVALRDDYPLEANLEVRVDTLPALPELEGERFTLRLSGGLGDLEAGLQGDGAIDARLGLEIDALDPTLPFHLRLASDRVQWPLTPDRPADYLVEDLALDLQGDLLGYEARLRGRLSGGDLPMTQLALLGSGDIGHFTWRPLSLTLPRGSLVSRGRIAWQEGIDLAADLVMESLDPGLFTPAVAGQLSGTAAVTFRLLDDSWQLAVPELAIDGELQEQPLSLQASLSGTSEMRWDIERLEARQGDNRLAIDGRIAETLALTGRLEAPALESLMEGLRGRLSGDFSVAGSLESPRAELALDGQQLAFQDTRLARLGLTARVEGLEDPRLAAELEADSLSAAGQRFENLTLTLAGRLGEHRLDLEVLGEESGPLERLVLGLDGALSENRQDYRGTLLPLEASLPQGTLALAEGLRFSVVLPAGRLTAEPFCLVRAEGGRLCSVAPLVASAASGEARLRLEALPMDLIDPALPPGWSLNGESDGEVILGWSEGGARWRLSGELGSRFALSGEDAYGQPWELPDSRLRLGLEASEARAEADLALSLSGAGEVALRTIVEDPLGSQALSGELSVEAIDLADYRRLVAGMETLEGRLDGRVAIAGSLEAPDLRGDLALEGLRVTGPDLPVNVRDGRLVLRLAGDRGTLEGMIQGEEGRLDLAGEAAWPSLTEWAIEARLEGRDDPLLAVLPEIGRLRLAPQLTIAVTPQRLEVGGRVQIPWARLQIGQLPPGVVSPSPDEVIVSEEEVRERLRLAAFSEDDLAAQESAAAALRQAGMTTRVRIDLSLGPDMQLEAYGLEAGLTGELEVRQADGPVQLFGDVNLVDGRFRAYGQDLLIREGQLIFSGPPDQPLLEVEAIRNPDVTQDEVIAGLRVTGLADEPELRIFSEPAMDEARALSYLLRGRAPDESDADGALTSALVGLTLSRTGGAVGQVGQAFGIEDLRLETAGAGEESQVVVAGQLTEDLRVSYGVGIFSPIAELTLRYTLWRNLYVQAVSGAAQAVDLVYTFSRRGNPRLRDSGE
ncbi:translocation/assembly module TamB domain-containing protein [Bisbaumannia pacifica]|uniref:autotransporter assembly complex protein TamB n=1 Tax=Bisbaumannia pacifica TaxID=77098 RepID=UPI002FC31BA8